MALQAKVIISKILSMLRLVMIKFSSFCSFCYNQPYPTPKQDGLTLVLRVSVASFRRAWRFSHLVLCHLNLITSVTIGKSELNNVCVKFMDRYRLNQ